jgi:hypothetical protein
MSRAEQIIRLCCFKYNVSYEFAITQRRRTKNCVKAIHLACWLIRQHICINGRPASLLHIAKRLNRTNHCIVNYYLSEKGLPDGLRPQDFNFAERSPGKRKGPKRNHPSEHAQQQVLEEGLSLRT